MELSSLSKSRFQRSSNYFSRLAKAKRNNLLKSGKESLRRLKPPGVCSGTG
jgi:hypothetical protein